MSELSLACPCPWTWALRWIMKQMSLGSGLARLVRLMRTLWCCCEVDSEADVRWIVRLMWVTQTPRPPPSLPMAPLLARWASRGGREIQISIYFFRLQMIFYTVYSSLPLILTLCHLSQYLVIDCRGGGAEARGCCCDSLSRCFLPRHREPQKR